MAIHNGDAKFDLRHELDDRFDMLKADVKKAVHRVTTRRSGEPTRLGWFVGKAGTAIEAHPFVAIGVAAGLGYLVTRIARR